MRRGWLAVPGAVLVVVFLALAVWSAHDVTRFDVASLARRTPPRTALMRQRAREAEKKGRAYRIDVRTVPYERISPLLRRAVLIAEDDRFFSHDGLDWQEMRTSAHANLESGHVVRGGSTITQQLAKNLYLGSERSLTRKLREAFLAIRMERALNKRRIFELYLNRIEWGDGIYGIEAAAHRYFGVGAGSLSPRQALLLAAVIINPVRYSVLHPPKRIERRVKMIAGRMRRRGYLSEGQYRMALGLPPAMDSLGMAVDTSGVAPPTAPSAPDSSGAPPADSAPPPAADSTATS